MNKSTRRILNEKNFIKELDFIEKINAFDNQKVVLLGEEDINTKFSKNKGKFNLEIDSRIIDHRSNIIFSFLIDNNIYETHEIGNIYSQSKFEIETFKSKAFNNKSKFKEFYQVDLKEIKTFHTVFETVTYQSYGTEKFYDCLRVKINNAYYDIIQLKHNSKGFYIIENLTEQTFLDFTEASFSLRQAIGFINNFYVGGEKFTFDNLGAIHYSCSVRPSLKGMYSPITTNPYSYSDIPEHIADLYYNKLTRITLDNLSKLANEIHNKPNFSTAIMVILEATSTRSLLLAPTIFAVVIELLSKALNLVQTTSKKLIDDKKFKNKIIKELYDVIDVNCKTLDANSVLKLKRRLNDINKPVNKKHLTNNEKLTRPFEELGVKLDIHDIEIIEHRNDLLHGNILLNNDKNKTDEKINSYMAYVSARLFTLVSKLILKSIGYKGYVYNQSKYLEKHSQITTNKDYFEIV
ncbi:hypothetical protein [Kordia jejudonensis]|uniref:hypothetical protein n=1 Tax=Kordia jejudonensis TaxID=1348245 RepID=UPI000629020A|nr:hypothetical protein [Kordia jejudonensis]